jgi:hypothetical protein
MGAGVHCCTGDASKTLVLFLVVLVDKHDGAHGVFSIFCTGGVSCKLPETAVLYVLNFSNPFIHDSVLDLTCVMRPNDTVKLLLCLVFLLSLPLFVILYTLLSFIKKKVNW